MKALLAGAFGYGANRNLPEGAEDDSFREYISDIYKKGLKLRNIKRISANTK